MRRAAEKEQGHGIWVTLWEQDQVLILIVIAGRVDDTSHVPEQVGRRLALAIDMIVQDMSICNITAPTLFTSPLCYHAPFEYHEVVPRMLRARHSASLWWA